MRDEAKPLSSATMNDDAAALSSSPADRVPDGKREERATEAITFVVASGKEAAFEEWAHGITAAATRWEGHLGASWLRPEHIGDEFQVVVAFRNEQLLEAWMGSEERKGWVDKLDGIATARSVRESGLETWFSLPGRRVAPPPRWKMTVVTFAGAYPLSLLFSWLLVPHAKGLELFARAALFPAVLLPIMTYLVMPRLSQLLRRFLYGKA